MSTAYWDTIAVGDVFEIGSHRFTADEIKRFAEKFDPQPFHLDEVAAAASLLGGLCASGWHTSAVAMRLNVDHGHAAIRRWIEAGHAAPRLGPSPGITNLRWPSPVMAGDTVTFTQTVTAKRVSASRPGWGVMETSTVGVSQDGKTVFSFDAAVFATTQ